MVLKGHRGAQPGLEVARPDQNPTSPRYPETIYASAHQEGRGARDRKEDRTPNPVRDDQETEAFVRVNQVTPERERTVQDVRVQSQGREPNEPGHAAQKSLQSPLAL